MSKKMKIKEKPEGDTSIKMKWAAFMAIGCAMSWIVAKGLLPSANDLDDVTGSSDVEAVETKLNSATEPIVDSKSKVVAPRWAMVKGMLPSGNDLVSIAGLTDVDAAKRKCTESQHCMGFTYDESAGLSLPYVFYKSKGTVILPDSGWVTWLKNAPASSQDVQVGTEGEQLVDDVDYDPRCGPDVTTTSNGRPFDCARNAANGECNINPGWMIMFCPNACQMCDLKLNRTMRCDRDRLNISSVPIYAPGDMDEMFEKLATHERYKKYKPEVLHKDPYIIKFHNFVGDDEIAALEKETAGQFKRSTDQGKFDKFGAQEKKVSATRTSENAWCQSKCKENPTVQKLYRKIEEATGVPYGNFENFQVLKYGVGQRYNKHHDQGAASTFKTLAGPRILTFFLYLSDVDEGGETDFPDVGLTVKPERGAAILWPSVLNSDLMEIEPNTHHAAMPVKKGTKFAANSWLHLYDYRVPNLWGCTGAFS